MLNDIRQKNIIKIITTDHLKNNNLLTAGEIISCYIQNPLMKKLCLSKQNIIIPAKKLSLPQLQLKEKLHRICRKYLYK